MLFIASSIPFWFALNHACGGFKPVLNTFKSRRPGLHGDQPCATVTRTPHPAMRYDDPSVFWDSDVLMALCLMSSCTTHYHHHGKAKLNLVGLSTLQK